MCLTTIRDLEMEHATSINRACEACKRYVSLFFFFSSFFSHPDWEECKVLTNSLERRRNVSGMCTQPLPHIVIRKLIMTTINQGDGRKPCCSLCQRIRASCHYPQRKSRVRDRHRSISTLADDSSTIESEADSRFTVNEPNSLGQTSETRGADFAMDGSRTSWGNFQDNYYYPSTTGSAEVVMPVFQASPTDQEMLDYLAQTLPDIWIPTPAPMMLDNNSITVSTKMPNDYRQDQVPSPNLTDSELHPNDDIDPSLEHDAFGIPASVVDEL